MPPDSSFPSVTNDGCKVFTYHIFLYKNIGLTTVQWIFWNDRLSCNQNNFVYIYKSLEPSLNSELRLGAMHSQVLKVLAYVSTRPLLAIFVRLWKLKVVPEAYKKVKSVSEQYQKKSDPCPLLSSEGTCSRMLGPLLGSPDRTNILKQFQQKFGKMSF